MTERQRNGVLIIVQNLPVPTDRRVWLEAQALSAAGFDVNVICPKGPGDPSRQVIDGIRIFKYRAPAATRGLAGYVVEFVWCWIMTALLSLVVKARHGFSVIQACNPPDTYWLLARIYRLVGVRFVYDQHDLNPELFRSRFGEPRTTIARAQLRTLHWLERRTYRAADRVIATNESYKRIAIDRGSVPSEHVTVVRSGPDTDRMRPIVPVPALRRGRKYLLVYLGIMGPQDNVDVLLDVMSQIVERRGRDEVGLTLLGSGDCLDELRARSRELGLEDVVHFTGRVGPDAIAEYLSTAALGLAPDLKTPLNDVSTHNKTMEYMAYGLPSVSFDLQETAITTGDDTAVAVPSGDITAFADAVLDLLDDEPRRIDMGMRARTRCVDLLDWRSQVTGYVDVFRSLVPGHTAPRESRPSWPDADRRGSDEASSANGGVAIDLRDPAAFAESLRRVSPDPETAGIEADGDRIH